MRQVSAGANMDGPVLTVHVAFTLTKRGGRKLVVVPDGMAQQRPRIDNTMVKAMARAFRWKRMLESGKYATIGDLAAHEKLPPSYLTRVLRLSLLSPSIVEEIVAGRHEAKLTLANLLEPFPAKWDGQLGHLRSSR